jgi:hypothetical protein
MLIRPNGEPVPEHWVWDIEFEGSEVTL